MKSITIYVEGGGATNRQQTELRQGFDALFHVQRARAIEQSVRLKLVCAGSRDEAFRGFKNAISKRREDITALLVDSEGEVPLVGRTADLDARIRVQHIRKRDKNWDMRGVLADRIHLMVQSMEAWIVADADALEEYYGKEFRRNALSRRANLEEEPKAGLVNMLDKACKETTKGEYHKINHASAILKIIDPSKVALRCPRFKLFTDWLDQTIAGA